MTAQRPEENRILGLNVVHGLPGDDIFSSRPKMTLFSPNERKFSLEGEDIGEKNWES